jgi:two-component system alkaline phosphatase synthesis response regulator PhoP
MQTKASEPLATILIIEDEPELVKVLRSYLEQAGFTVYSSGRGDSGLATWEQRQPDLVILDLNLPGMDGLDVARAIRRKAHTPILMLTARVEEADQLVGLELGADDYLPKPFRVEELLARVRALLRRAAPETQAPPRLRLADRELALAAHAIRRAGETIELTPTEFSLLVALAEQPGRVFSRLQLLEATQGTAYEGYERSVDAHIKNLRAKLERDPRHPSYIETVFGVGYRFAQETARRR